MTLLAQASTMLILQEPLRRFKDDVAEVRGGVECGVVLADTNDVKPGDMLEVFEVEMRDRTL